MRRGAARLALSVGLASTVGVTEPGCSPDFQFASDGGNSPSGGGGHNAGGRPPLGGRGPLGGREPLGGRPNGNGGEAIGGLGPSGGADPGGGAEPSGGAGGAGQGGEPPLPPPTTPCWPFEEPGFMECRPGEVCCYDAVWPYEDRCSADGCGIADYQLSCDGPSDCPGGTCCAYQGAFAISTTCRASCNFDEAVACSPSEPCPAGQECLSLGLGGGYENYYGFCN